MTIIAENLARIKERMAAAARRAGRDPESVRLVAVSKRVAVARIMEAMAAGQSLFGENYVQEACDKIERVGVGASWHFIGHLQSNKARAAAHHFEVIETVDSVKLARNLDRELTQQGKRQSIFIQVNVGKEPQKSGVLPEDLVGLARQLAAFTHLDVQGLMTMPPYCEDPEAMRPFFRALRLLAEELLAQQVLGHDHLELSMGMSADFEVAIEEGATLVRVGTALFGERD